MFSVVILNPQKILFEGQAKKVFLKGDEGEFEILENHAPVISVLSKGKVVIDGKTSVSVRSGIVRFEKDSLVVLAEAG